MNKQKAKILMLVEGAKTDVVLMKHLLEVYGISDSHQIVSYNTNIYVLYNRMFKDDDPETLDLLQVLKENEKDESKKKIFDERYSDILLVFDLDPQDDLFSATKIQQMLEYFKESSENGKLYINYPMVEAFYHMKAIPDPDFNKYEASLTELQQKSYKARVQSENRDHDYRKFAKDLKECNTVISQNVEKALLITNNSIPDRLLPPCDLEILDTQVRKIQNENRLFVLCTCGFYIIDYNPNLITQNDERESNDLSNGGS